MEKLIRLLKGMVPILCESDHVDFVESDHVAPPLMIRDFVMPSYCRDNNHFPLVAIFFFLSPPGLYPSSIAVLGDLSL